MANTDKRTNLPGGRSKPKKPITVGKRPGDGGASYKPRDPFAPGGNRSMSTKPSQAGLVRSAKKTTSSGITKRPNGRAQGEGRSGRQSISNAKVTSEAKTRPSGERGIFEKPNPKVTRGKGSQLATVAKIASVAKGVSPATVAYETLKARPTADGTRTAAMKRGDYKPRQGPNVPKRLTQGGMDKGSFNSAFKASRTAGKKTFTWRGKKYTTEMK
jgi:hypothetical protein